MERTVPSFSDAFKFWLKLGFISFGGPAGQIAVMHEELVEKRKWISEERFLHALNFCMLLPGPEAQQLATYIGWLLHGVRGGIAAGVLFILPAAILLWGLSWIYMAWGDLPWLAAIFHGLQPAVLAIVLSALIRIAGKSLKSPWLWAIAILAFIAIFFLHTPFVAVIAIAAVAGMIAGRSSETQHRHTSQLPEAAPTQPPRTLQTIATCLVLWAAPLAALWLIFGAHNIYLQQGLFFSKAALVTFGGAYAVLPYVTDQAVNTFGWLAVDQMMAGLALAETTPGPLILVLQFVGFAGAWQAPGTLSPLAAGTLGALITTWTTFLPSFLFVLTGAPYIERLRQVKALRTALEGITAAVVGVILNLAVWFGIHTLVSAEGKLDVISLLIATGMFLGLWKWRWNLIYVVFAGGVLGFLRHAAGWSG